MANSAVVHPQKKASSFPSPSRPRWLMIGFWISVLIALAVVVRRTVALLHPGAGTSPMAGLDARFTSHTALTFAHIIPAALFVLLSVTVLLRPPRVRIVYWLFFLLGAITGLTAYAMARFAIGGVIEQSAVAVFDTYFLISLGTAFRYFLEDEAALQRRWTVRGVAVLLGIAATRPVMALFFATSPLTHLTQQQFFGIAFWIGFSINAVVVELWLHRRAAPRAVKVRSFGGRENA